MSRKTSLSNKIGGRRKRNTSVTTVTTVTSSMHHSTMALALREDNYEVIHKGFSKEMFRDSETLAKMSVLSGLSIDEILKKVSNAHMNNMIFNVSELSETGEVCMKLDVLYDVSGSMWFASNVGEMCNGGLYIPFHQKMAKVFSKLESEGVKIRIFFFSNLDISTRPPITVDKFCSNNRIPGGGTVLGPAWNQLVNSNGSVLLVTDGQFSDQVSEFNVLSQINSLTLAIPSWTTVSTGVVQQLRDNLGTIPLNHLPNCDSTHTVEQMAEQVKRGSNVVAIPDGYMRFGDIVFPECWKKPSVIGMLVNNMLQNNRDSIPIVFGKFNEIFTQILCTMKVDFEGCLKSEDSRNLLQMVNVFMKTSLREMNQIEGESSSATAMEPEPETQTDNEYNYFMSMNEICKKIFDFGSNEKDERTKKYASSGLNTQVEEINDLWDTCFSSDETGDIIMSHNSDKQTHTLIFKVPMPYEIIRQIRASAHALDKETMLCLIMYFSKGNYEMRQGIYIGYGTIPVWNGNLVDSIRLLPSHVMFPDADGVSFTFSATVAYRILMWLTAESFGPNKNIFP